MPRVDPGNPDGSWLMVKLTAEVYDTPDLAGWIRFTPDSDWSQPDTLCAYSAGDGTPLFGLRMPATAPNLLDDADLAAVRQWILYGAPGP